MYRSAKEVALSALSSPEGWIRQEVIFLVVVEMIKASSPTYLLGLAASVVVLELVLLASDVVLLTTPSGAVSTSQPFLAATIWKTLGWSASGPRWSLRSVAGLVWDSHGCGLSKAVVRVAVWLRLIKFPESSVLPAANSRVNVTFYFL